MAAVQPKQIRGPRGRVLARPRDRGPTEHDEQVALCRWLDARGIGYFAVPNGARVRPAQAKKLKAEGMTAGAPDLVLTRRTLDGRPIAVEVKREVGGVMSRAQRAMQDRLTHDGWICIVARGGQDGIEQITETLGGAGITGAG